MNNHPTNSEYAVQGIYFATLLQIENKNHVDFNNSIEIYDTRAVKPKDAFLDGHLENFLKTSTLENKDSRNTVVEFVPWGALFDRDSSKCNLKYVQYAALKSAGIINESTSFYFAILSKNNDITYKLFPLTTDGKKSLQDKLWAELDDFDDICNRL
ncbi:MAG: hypothetical protein ACP5N1_03770 [Candidatus Woesearchaeota archaeon]